MLNLTSESTVKNFIIYARAKGLTDNGIAGILGNLYAESGVRCNNLQNSSNKNFGMTDEEFTKAVDNGTFDFLQTKNFGYGLAQWTTYGRRKGLYNLKLSKNVSIADEQLQFEYLFWELSTKYKPVLKILTDSRATIRQCAESFVCKFEVPASVIAGGTKKENTIRIRTNYAQEFYNAYLKEEKKMEYLITAQKLVSQLKMAAKLKTVYVYGGLGGNLTQTNKNRALKAYSENNRAAVKNADGDTWGFDCVGLIKSIVCGFTATKTNPKTGKSYNYGGAAIPSSGAYSAKYGARQFFKTYCNNISSDFTKIKAGQAVWLETGTSDSHIGVYVGDGLVVESTPKWSDGVQLTACGNIGKISGYNTRSWSYYGDLPQVDYSGMATETKTESTNTNIKIATAKYKDTKLAKTYTTTTMINLRSDATPKSTLVVVMPKDTCCKCFGFYSKNGLRKWYLVQATVNGKIYTGYAHSGYLK